MKITTCYTAELKQQLFDKKGSGKKGLGKIADPVWGRVDDGLMKSTASVCLGALRFCVDAFLSRWEYLSALPAGEKAGVLSRKRAGDILVHGTEGSRAEFAEFDELFPCMPAFMRRAIVADALGMASSYTSNHENWERQPPSERGSEPTLGLPSRYELTFYSQERDLCNLEKGVVGFKLYDGVSWAWHYFKISPSDAGYISRMKDSRKMLSPVVEKARGSYRVRFSFEEAKELVSDENPLGYRILAVDLGINAAASWCVMEADGTVHAKGVIRLGCEEGRLRRLINRKRMYQQAGKKPRCNCRMVNAANRALSIETCRRVIELAVLYDADCIVFERLGRNGRVKGRRYRERIHLWRANDVQKRVELQAHRAGMRVSRVCAWGTSRLAFDGSGAVVRDRGNHSLCTFQGGKRYNCDLSACQNIGARYFLRLMEGLPGCPELPKTPQRTYATLVSAVKQIAEAA